MIMSESEENVQAMLEFVHEWCRKCRLRINYAKSSVVHFLNKGKERTVVLSDFISGTSRINMQVSTATWVVICMRI